ncbi:MAG: hypothetical protein KDB07_04140, partial [Planctomycetes bacterium]|nr:hypothetical protein [Planctomycetota bacterium]
MAVLDYVKLYKDKGKDSWGKLQPRQKVIFAGIGIAIVTLFVVLVATIGGGAGGWTPLRVPTNDPEAAIRKLAIFGIEARFDEKESAVVVESDKEVRAARILSSAKLLPNGDKAYGFVKESNLAQTDSARQMAYRVELQTLLSETIGAMHSVDNAIVNITPASRPYYFRFGTEDLRAKSSVMVQTVDNRALNEAEVLSIAQLVAGSQETMNPENVYIQDTSGRHYPINKDWRQTYTVNSMTLAANARAENSARVVLSAYNPFVSATVQMRTGAIESKEHKLATGEKPTVTYSEERNESQ